MGLMAGVKIKSHHLGQPGRMVAGLMNLIGAIPPECPSLF
jgi:hypothetical protein